MFRSFFYARFDCRFLVGAQPHSRGDKLVHHGHNGFRARLIPTHAGKTRSAAARMTSGRVHPRSYGENNTALSFMEEDVGSSPLTRGNTIIGHTSAENPGSSPLTRGKPCGEGTPCVPEGLIPTHEGKTLSGRSWLASRPAHPRSRGENVAVALSPSMTMGSSPLTRGKCHDPGPELPCGRLIPTHAGKT